MATKASKARALPKFWVTVNPLNQGGQIMPTTVLWALSGSNSPWRPWLYDGTPGSWKKLKWPLFYSLFYFHLLLIWKNLSK